MPEIIQSRAFRPDERLETQGIAIPLGQTELTVRLDRQGFTLPSGQVFVELELSLDGGETWGGSIVEDKQCRSLWYRVQAELTPHVTREGKVSTETTLKVPLPQPDNPKRQYRLSLRSQRAVTTRLTVD